MLRWCVDVRVWNPSPSDFEQCLRRLPLVERQSCHAFRHRIDQKRAFLSRLLQREAIHRVTGISYSDILIRRTHGKKPFLATPLSSPSLPNFNFNVAHEVCLSRWLSGEGMMEHGFRATLWCSSAIPSVFVEWMSRHLKPFGDPIGRRPSIDVSFEKRSRLLR